MVERFTYGNFELTKRRWPTRRHSRAGVKKEIPRIFIPRRLYPFLPSFLFSAARIPARRTRLSIRAIREIALPRTGRIEPRSTRDKVSRIETYPMGRGGSVAFYALNVHSEVGRRWKRDKAAVFRLFLRAKGRFCREIVRLPTGNGAGGCSFRSSRPARDESGVEKTVAARQKSWSIYFCRMRSVDADRERENPLSAEGTTRGPPWFRRVTSPFRYLYLLRNFFGGGGAP